MSPKALIIAAAFVYGCSAKPVPSKADSFSKVVTYQTTSADLATLMGEPTRRAQIEILDMVNVEVVEFEDSVHQYVVTIGGSRAAGVEPRVLAKAMYPKANEKR